VPDHYRVCEYRVREVSGPLRRDRSAGRANMLAPDEHFVPEIRSGAGHLKNWPP